MPGISRNLYYMASSKVLKLFNTIKRKYITKSAIQNKASSDTINMQNI